MIVDVTNGDQPNVTYWKAERFLIRWETTAEEVVFGYISDGQGIEVARYSVAADGIVLIDVTDFVRAYPERNRLVFSTAEPTLRGVSFTVAGKINPAGVLIPFHKLQEAASPALITPPHKMLLDVDGSPFVMAEFYAAVSNFWNIQGYAQWTSRDRHNIEAFELGGYTLAYGTTTEEYRPELADPCKPIALVEWESLTGATRRHVFYVSKQTSETADAFTLENLQNEYTEIKGTADSFALRLEDLTRYDLWYYSDLVNSSNVRVSIDGGVTFYSVQVAEKKYTIPDSDEGKLSTLEIVVNFRKYDAVNM